MTQNPASPVTSTSLTSTPADSAVSTDSVGVPPYRYTAELAGELEAKWQSEWAQRKTFNTPNPEGDLADGSTLHPDDKLFVLDMFPFPSGAGLHVGHPLGFIATDVYARYQRMLGKNVLHTMGFDSFGLPAEQYAVQTGAHPRPTTEANIERYLQQIRRIGLAHDERRRVATTDVDFYQWTQWIFLQIFYSWYDEEAGKARHIDELIAQFASGSRETELGKAWEDLDEVAQAAELDRFRLVYESRSLVNWCPGLGTVLANEEVTADGRSERGNFPVFRKNLRQWMMRITAYSDRLLDDLAYLDWPEKVKSMQRNWIGRSQGAQVSFEVATHPELAVDVFTTRPDTLFGATYLVLAPEHELVDQLVAESYSSTAENFMQADSRWMGGESSPALAVAAYRRSIAAKSDLERQENKEKTGIFLGAYAINPVNGEKIPVFIADYVLAGYGTGAIMAVPGHDQRDYDFATVFGLPIREVISSKQGIAEQAYSGEGPLVNSDFLDGLSISEAKTRIIERLESAGKATGTCQYKLRDWLFARQRYWGEPFPIVFDSKGIAHPLPESSLPIILPEVEDFWPVTFDPDAADSEPSPPLTKATDWLNLELDLGDGLKSYTRDANVMPNWAGSSWYQLRYIDPTNSAALVGAENEAYWVGPRPNLYGPNDPGGVDLYVGGVEHAVLHLLYARFWHKVLFDLGHVSSSEPYRRLFNQGMIQAYAYTDDRGTYVPAEEVTEQDGKFYFQDQPVNREYGKMGKSLKNSVAPDEIANEYGADTLRVYEMAMGPLDASRPWATKDVIGAQRFLQRVWRTAVDEHTGELTVTAEEPTDASLKVLHKTIFGVREDYLALRDNTAVAKLIEFTNHLTKSYPNGIPKKLVEPLILMVAPVAPHLAEELWERLGNAYSLARGPFPEVDESWLVEDEITYVIQVKGKTKTKLTVAASTSEAEIIAAVLSDEKVASELAEGGEPRKVIFVPGKLVNIVP